MGVKLLQSADIKKTKVEPILLETGQVNPSPNERTTAAHTRSARGKPNIHTRLVASYRENRNALIADATLARMKQYKPLVLTNRKSQ